MSNTEDPYTQTSSAAGTELAGIQDDRGLIWVKVYVTESLSGPITLKSSSRLVVLQVAGTTGTIMDDVTAPGPFTVVTQEVESDVLLKSLGSEGMQLTVNGPGLSGDVECAGRLRRLDAITAIGSAADSVLISAAGGIGAISTAGDVYAVISGGLQSAAATSVSVGGDLIGSLQLSRIESLEIGGDLDGVVSVNTIKGQTSQPGAGIDVWRIGGSFKAGSIINVLDDLPDRNGLGGVVVFNAANGSGTWEPTAAVRGFDGSGNLRFELGGPDYPNEAYRPLTAGFDDVGYGAVGVASFGLHEAACRPDSGASVEALFASVQAAQGQTVRLAQPKKFYENTVENQTTPDRARVAFMRFYGRLSEELSGAGFVVERRRQDPGSTAVWTDISHGFVVVAQNWFQLDYHLNVSNFSFHGLYAGFEYRVRPSAHPDRQLLCVDAGSAPYSDFSYSFTVHDPCVADITGDGLVNSNDLAPLLGVWGACAGDLVPCWADFDGDGLVNSNDISILLGAWGACPPADEGGGEGGESMMMAQGGGEGPIYEQFGFESAAEYAAWFSSLDEAAKNAHVAELIELLLGGG